MEALVTYIVKNLADDKEAVKIETHDSESIVRINISCAKDDMGKIIGKEGKVIQSIRTLVKILAVKQNKYVTVTISEPVVETPTT